MRFAIITDIHGNYPALKAVLNQIDLKEAVDHIYCLGDMIAIGPYTNEVLDTLFHRNDISMITGNHDEAVLAVVNHETYPESHRGSREHHQWIAEQLNPSYISNLKNLPRMITKECNERAVHFTHYHMTPEKQNVHISKDPFSRIVPEEKHHIISLFDDYSSDLICFGHHHPIHYFHNDAQAFLNPGALGCSRDSIARYAVVDMADGRIDIQLNGVQYDKASFLNSYETLNVPERDFLIRAFHGGSPT